ncbi:conserved hypothetical protein [Mycobacterium tuberculosis T17]|nr:conserved hypothetical protein [Mycobacterium tuberculosis T17]MXI69275.1 hypothetical protein [Mycobacterium tuberculosis]
MGITLPATLGVVAVAVGVCSRSAVLAKSHLASSAGVCRLAMGPPSDTVGCDVAPPPRRVAG